MAMLYTHSWGTFFFIGSAIALIPSLLVASARPARAAARRGDHVSIGAGILYLPWVPTLLFQIAHTAAPWDTAAAVRRADPDLAQRARRRQDHDACWCSPAADRAGATVHARPAAQRRGGEAVHAGPLPLAMLVIAWVGSQVNPALGAAVLRAGDRRDAVPDRLGVRAGPTARDRRDRALVCVPGQPVRVRAQVQVRYALRRAARSDRCCIRAIWSSSASPSRRRSPGTTCPAGCAAPTPRAARSPIRRYMNWVNALDALTQDQAAARR